MGKIEQKLVELGIELPPPPAPVAIYEPAVTVNDLVYTSGTGCKLPGGGLLYVGKLGTDLTIEQGQQAARQTALNILAILQAHLGSLDRVRKVVKVLGLINSADDFTEQPKVLNGASELLVQVFGDSGKHARSAIGTNVLPNNMPVEIEIIVQIDNEIDNAAI